MDQRPLEQYGYLLESISSARLFVKRRKDYDPELIGRCNANFLLYRRDTTVLGRIRETDPKIRRMTIEYYKHTELTVMNNTDRWRVLNTLCQDKVMKSSGRLTECSFTWGTYSKWKFESERQERFKGC